MAARHQVVPPAPKDTAHPGATTVPGPATDAEEGPRPYAPFPLRRDWPVMAGVAAVASTVYLWTMLPGLGGSGDTAKWQFLGKVGGLPHPTGYPLYLLVNKVFVTVVPFGTLAWRANLLSVVCATAAVVVAYRLVQALGVRRPVAASTSLVFAFSLTFWSQALVAEVYSLHVLLMITVLACLARWKLGGPNGWLLAGTAVYAMSFGNNLGALMLLPGFAWVVWTERRRSVTLFNAVWVLAWIVLGAGQYLLVWSARNSHYIESRIDNLSDLIEYVSGDWFKVRMFAFGAGQMLRERVPMLVHLLAWEYSLLIFIALFGVWRLAARPGPRRTLCVAVLLYAAAATVYGLGYNIPDVSVYFLALFLAIAIFLGAGIEGLLQTAGTRRLPWAPTVMLVGAIPLLMLGANWSRVNLGHETGAAEHVEALLDSVPDGAVVALRDYTTYEYVQEQLLGEGIGAERNLVAVHADADSVTAYVQGRTSDIVGFAGRNRPLYSIDPDLTADLAGKAVETTDVGNGVSAVRAG